MFEPLDVATAGEISSNIRETLSNYEPRIAVLGVEVIANFEDNGFDVALEFENCREDFPATLEFFLERTRQMPYVQLSNLDFEDIKTALKEYLRSQQEFTGSLILRVLSGQTFSMY